MPTHERMPPCGGRSSFLVDWPAWPWGVWHDSIFSVLSVSSLLRWWPAHDATPVCPRRQQQENSGSMLHLFQPQFVTVITKAKISHKNNGSLTNLCVDSIFPGSVCWGSNDKDHRNQATLELHCVMSDGKKMRHPCIEQLTSFANAYWHRVDNWTQHHLSICILYPNWAANKCPKHQWSWRKNLELHICGNVRDTQLRV